MGQSTSTLTPEIEILFYDVETCLSETKLVCVSRLDQNVFCLVCNGVAVIQEQILDFSVFEAGLRNALARLKAVGQSDLPFRQIQFVIDGLHFPIDATIEQFCSSENLADFTMSFSSKEGKQSSWMSMGEASLENLLHLIQAARA